MIASVILAGFQTTVQDCGRVGLRKFGVTPGGALDSGWQSGLHGWFGVFEWPGTIEG